MRLCEVRNRTVFGSCLWKSAMISLLLVTVREEKDGFET
jgi:hypothetical protein